MYSLLFIVGSSELLLDEFLRDRKQVFPVSLFTRKINGLQPQIVPELRCVTSRPD